MKKQVLISLSILLFIVVGTVFVAIYAKGYKIDFNKGKPEIAGTGLLVATSIPDGAQVLINGHLTTATNNTINLPPGIYKVEIAKDGYFTWKKTITIENEVVSKAEAVLFPNAPQLESITALGVKNPVLDPSGTKIAFTVASQSAKKNGIYVFNMDNSSILTLQSASTQIIDDASGDIFSNSQLSWSPDGKNILATVSNNNKTTQYLLSATSFNSSPKDVTETIGTLMDSFKTEENDKKNAQIASLKPDVNKLVLENFSIISWSPDETKILYVASTSATLPLIINPPLLGGNSTNQERTIEKDGVYIYDIKEDKNYKILNNISQIELAHMPLKWLGDNIHLLHTHDKKVDILEYDNSNITTIYAGPFLDTFVFPWPNASKFVILTNLGNDQIAPNLYTVGLR